MTFFFPFFWLGKQSDFSKVRSPLSWGHGLDKGTQDCK